MSAIRNLHSEEQKAWEFLSNLQQRILEQKYLYTEGRARNYYSTSGLSQQYAEQKQNPYTAFLVQAHTHLSKEKDVLLVSLGCGNLVPEIIIAEHLQSAGYVVSILAVDFSQDMLALAAEELSSHDIPYELWCTDFSSFEFRQAVDARRQDNQQRIFTFLGGTLGNVSQTQIVDTLYNILSIEDFIWIDTAARPSLSKAENLSIFEKYADRLKDKDEMNFCFAPLKDLGVPFNAGHMLVRSEENESIGVLSFTYSFEFIKPVSVMYKGDRIHMLPKQKIDLLTIRVYHAPTFISFFEQNDFICLDKLVEGHDVQYLFRKKER